MIIRNLIAELNPWLTDDMQVEAFENPSYSDEAIRYFIEEYWSRQQKWVQEWTLELMRTSKKLDILDQELYEVLQEDFNEK